MTLFKQQLEAVVRKIYELQPVKKGSTLNSTQLPLPPPPFSNG